MAIGCAYKWSTGSETGTFAVTQAGAVTGHATMIVMSIAGAHASTGPEAGGRASGTAGGATPGSLNPAGWGTEDTLWLMVGGSGETNTTGSFTGITAGNPTNYTDNFTTSITADAVGGLNASVAFRQLNAASEDPPAFTDDTSNARWGAITIGVRPVPAPPNTGAATGSVSWAGAATGTKITFVAAIDVTHSAGTPEFVVPAGVVSTDLMVLGITNADATASFGIPGATAIVGPTDTGSMQGVVLTGTGYTASDTVVFTGTTSAMIPSTFVAAWYRGAGTVGTPTSATKGGTVTTLIASDITGESATARRVVVFLEKSGSNVSSTAPTVTGVTNRAWEPWASSAAGQPSSWIGDYAEAPSEAKTITYPQSSANGLAGPRAASAAGFGYGHCCVGRVCHWCGSAPWSSYRCRCLGGIGYRYARLPWCRNRRGRLGRICDWYTCLSRRGNRDRGLGWGYYWHAHTEGRRHWCSGLGWCGDR
jgi:hypothetical protein